VATKQKPVPQPYQDTQKYWDAAKQKRLILQRCGQCDEFQFYPRGVCSHCLASDLRWVDASGNRKIHSFTVSYRAPHPGFEGDLPFVLAIVELDEGVRMMSNIVNCDPKAVRIDMKVKVVFEELTPEITLPQFALV